MKISERQERILKAIIADYLESGKPVSSAKLVKKHDIPASPATVRYEMSTLEQEGLVKKRHSSSGRIPTATGLRHYLTSLFDGGVVDYMLEMDVKQRLSKVKFERELLLREAVSILAEQSEFLGFCVMDDGPRIGGLSNLLVMKKSALRILFVMLEDEKMFRDVLEKSEHGSAGVLLGDEIGLAGMKEAAIAYKSVQLYGENGWFGVLGPISMDYRTILPIVDMVSDTAITEASHWGKKALASPISTEE